VNMQTLLYFVVLTVLVGCALGEDSPCANLTDCGACTASWNCLWCVGTETCIDGMMFGPKSTNICEGDDWRYKQCQVKGLWLTIGGFGGIAFLVLICVIVTCCCCCKKPKHKEPTPEELAQLVNEPNTEYDGELVFKEPANKRRSLIYDKYSS